MLATILDDKRQAIFDHERLVARRLARRVMEKPVPPAWMILVPIYFLFYALKLKDYAKGLDTFTGQYLACRCRALDAATEAIAGRAELDIEPLIAQASPMPEAARPHYRQWLTHLMSHYHNLLATDGSDLPTMTRGHYRNKTSYMLFTRKLNSIESTLNTRLASAIEGDRDHITATIEKMRVAIEELRSEDLHTIFQ